jgi:drug/metabolite transporter (DMT)-like permease
MSGTTSNSRQGLIGAATIVLTLLGWSSIPLFLKHFTHLLDPWTMNGWRYAFSALLWAPVLIIGTARKSLPQNLWRAAVWPSVFNAAGQACFAIVPYYIDPGLMTFSLRIQIVFVTLGAALLFPAERLVIKRPGFLFGIACVVGGTIATILLNPHGLGRGTGIGVTLAITSGLLYGAYALSVRHYMHGVNSLQAFAAISQYTALILIIPMFILGEHAGADPVHLVAPQFGLLLLSSLIGIGLGHTLYYFSMNRLGLAVSSGVVQLQPFLVSVASVFLFDEKLTLGQWIAGSIAIFGALVILFEQRQTARKPAKSACKECGYDMSGLSVCPECGQAAA